MNQSAPSKRLAIAPYGCAKRRTVPEASAAVSCGSRIVPAAIRPWSIAACVADGGTSTKWTVLESPPLASIHARVPIVSIVTSEVTATVLPSRSAPVRTGEFAATINPDSSELAPAVAAGAMATNGMPRTCAVMSCSRFVLPISSEPPITAAAIAAPPPLRVVTCTSSPARSNSPACFA